MLVSGDWWLLRKSSSLDLGIVRSVCWKGRRGWSRSQTLEITAYGLVIVTGLGSRGVTERKAY